MRLYWGLPVGRKDLDREELWRENVNKARSSQKYPQCIKEPDNRVCCTFKKLFWCGQRIQKISSIASPCGVFSKAKMIFLNGPFSVSFSLFSSFQYSWATTTAPKIIIIKHILIDTSNQEIEWSLSHTLINLDISISLLKLIRFPFVTPFVITA